MQLPLEGDERTVFRMRRGTGPTMTLLHGFPSSSHDWAKVAPALAARHTVLAPDFLGFGASEKPADHRYSLHEQADLVEALWEAEGVHETVLVAHDYGVSVAQELLARAAEGALAVELREVHFLNGGLYPELHRPQPMQTALLDPEQGPRISELVNEELFVAGLAPTFAPGLRRGRRLRRDLGGDEPRRRRAHRAPPDRLHRRSRAPRGPLDGALEATSVPVRFVWGMLDPVSGAHMAERIRERLPQAPFTALADVSHWPPLEAPERVAAALLG